MVCCHGTLWNRREGGAEIFAAPGLNIRKRRLRIHWPDILITRPPHLWNWLLQFFIWSSCCFLLKLAIGAHGNIRKKRSWKISEWKFTNFQNLPETFRYATTHLSIHVRISCDRLRFRVFPGRETLETLKIIFFSGSEKVSESQKCEEFVFLSKLEGPNEAKPFLRFIFPWGKVYSSELTTMQVPLVQILLQTTSGDFYTFIRRKICHSVSILEPTMMGSVNSFCLILSEKWGQSLFCALLLRIRKENLTLKWMPFFTRCLPIEFALKFILPRVSEY